MFKKVGMTLLGLLIIANFFIFYAPRTVSTLQCCDEFEYYAIAHNLALGHGYSIRVQPPFYPTLLREPLYPLLLAFTIKLGGDSSLLLAQIINVLLLGASAFMLLKLARAILPPRTSWLPPVLFLLSPRVAHYSWTILSDALGIFFLLLSLTLTFYGKNHQKTSFFFLAGIAFGALTLTKMAFVLFLPGFLAAYFLIRIIAKKFMFLRLQVFREHLPRYFAGALLAGFIIVLTPWVVRNAILFKKPVLTVRAGQLLDERTRPYGVASSKEFITRTIEDMIPTLRGRGSANTHPTDAKEKPVVTPFGATYGLASKNAPSKFFSLIEAGLSEPEADRRMVAESLARIASHKMFYVIQLPFETVKFFYPEFLPGVFGLVRYGSPIMWATTLGLGLLTALFFLLLVKGIAHLLQNPSFLVILFIFLTLYAAAVHILLYVTPRYSFIIYPMLLIFVSGGLSRTTKKSSYIRNPEHDTQKPG